MNLKDTVKKKINIIIQLIWPLFFLLMSRFGDGRSMAYLAASVESILLLLLIFLYGMPQGTEKLMRSRIARGQLKNAGMIFKSGALITVLFTAAFGCILFGVSEAYAVSLLHMPFAVLSLRIFIAFFVCAALILLFQGFFQGTGSYMPTLVSSIGFAVMMTAGGIGFVLLFEGYGQKAAALLQNEAVVGMYIAAGAGLGIAVAGIIPLVLLVFLYFGTGRRRLRQWKKEGLKRSENLGRAGKLVFISACSIACVYLLNRFPVYLGILFYQGATEGAKTELLGSYYSIVEMMGLFFILLLSIGLVRCQNTVTNAIKREESKNARENLSAAIQWSLMTALFFPAFSMGVETSVHNLCFSKMQGTEGMLPIAGVLAAVFLLAVFFLKVNLSVGLKRQVYLSLLAAMAVYIVFVLAGLKITHNSIYVLAWGRILFGAVVCGTNGFYLSRQINFQPEWIRTILFPIVSAGITGVILFLLKKALYTYLGDVLMFLVALILGIICYMALLMGLKSIRKRELKMMPGGRILEKVGSLLHLL